MPPRARRRAHGGPYSTTASEAPCQHCRRPLIYAWDEGLLARADALGLDQVVAEALRGAGRTVYALTAGRQLVRETAERAGSLRMVTSRHLQHACSRAPAPAGARYETLELFDLDQAHPRAPRNGGMW